MWCAHLGFGIPLTNEDQEGHLGKGNVTYRVLHSFWRKPDSQTLRLLSHTGICQVSVQELFTVQLIKKCRNHLQSNLSNLECILLL